MSAYYNENDPKAAAWLRELIRQGHIADGVVDERSIADVQPEDIREFTQCHFFAGIGGWSLALRLAGWADDRPVWTGSCPCQPFSAAGKGLGTKDERHLWPEFRRLIAECDPPTVFGEQVASKAGREWLSDVRLDLEALGYAVGATDLGAASVYAPHIRQRLWWVGDSCSKGLQKQQRIAGELREEGCPTQGEATERAGAPTGWVADPSISGERALDRQPGQSVRQEEQDRGSSVSSGMADPSGERRERRERSEKGCEYDRAHAGREESHDGFIRELQAIRETRSTRQTHSQWRNADWLFCRDGKWRPVEPGTFPLAHGVPARVGRLRGYGNAIVPQVAAEFIGAFMDVIHP